MTATQLKEYLKLQPILHKLAKRKVSDADDWFQLNHKNIIDGNIYHKCLICNNSVVGFNEAQMIAHGISHLKEANLLPFI